MNTMNNWTWHARRIRTNHQQIFSLSIYTSVQFSCPWIFHKLFATLAINQIFIQCRQIRTNLVIFNAINVRNKWACINITKFRGIKNRLYLTKCLYHIFIYYYPSMCILCNSVCNIKNYKSLFYRNNSIIHSGVYKIWPCRCGSIDNLKRRFLPLSFVDKYKFNKYTLLPIRRVLTGCDKWS